MHMVPAAVLTQSKPVSLAAVRPVCAVVPKIMVTRPRHAHSIQTKSKSPIRRHITCSPSPKTSNSPPRVTAAQAPVVIAAKGKKEKWVFFLATKDETSPIFKTFITGLENQLSLKVKVIRSDNRTEFNNSDLNQFCGLKGIKKEFSVPRNPQQNGIAERKNRTLIEAARTMLADSLLPIPFWVEAVNTTCYVQNRVLVTKPHNKTAYELLHGRKGIKRDYSNARTPQQNEVSEKKNRTLIEAVRTMLADSLLPTIFWTKAVATACYVLNRLNAEQADWRDDTNDESKDQELEARYMYMAQIEEVSPDAADSGPIFDTEPLIGNVAGARETVGSTVVQKFGIQCYNCKEYRHVARECQKPKRVKDVAYHREKMILCKQEEARIQLNAEQADWRDDTDDELEDQELEAHYMYMAQLQEVSPDATDFGPIFDMEPVQKISTDDHYNVFSIESEHTEQSKSVHDTYLLEQDEHNMIIDSLDMSYEREHIDQNDDDADLVNERELLDSLIEKLKCEIDESKNRNKFWKHQTSFN
nr:putative ribonuclease H-like domain-containing protein [Tanacetum cinerariifolium]